MLAAGALLEPAGVAEAVVAGLADGRFLILPHPRWPSSNAAGPPTATAGWPACAGPDGGCSPERLNRRGGPGGMAGLLGLVDRFEDP